VYPALFSKSSKDNESERKRAVSDSRPKLIQISRLKNVEKDFIYLDVPAAE